MYQFLRVETVGAVAVIAMNRPDKLNALNNQLHGELIDVFRSLRGRKDVRAVVLASDVEKAFSAGQDVNDFPMAEGIMLAISAPESAPYYETILIESLDKPVIAALNGYVLGGGLEVALACDFRIASEDARLGFPEVNLGVFPGTGGTQRLVRIVGRARALDLILTGRMITALEALEMGIVNKVVKKEELRSECLALAVSLAEKPPEALRIAKESVIRGAELPLQDALFVDTYRRFVLACSPEREKRRRAFLGKQGTSG